MIQITLNVIAELMTKIISIGRKIVCFIKIQRLAKIGTMTLALKVEVLIRLQRGTMIPFFQDKKTLR